MKIFYQKIKKSISWLVFIGLLINQPIALAVYPPSGSMHDVAVDFQSTFSILDACCSDLKTTITECCQNIEEDFAFTWTILDTLQIDLNGIATGLSVCCALLEQDFAFTWTILANLQTNFTGTMLVDLSGVFTELEDIQSTITDCCATLEQDFAFTWTILADIKDNIDITGLFTVLADNKNAITGCCARLEQDFAFTWTILANLDNDNSGVFTALADIKDTLTDCCATLEQDFAFTWTILNNLTANVNLSGVFTALDACCSDITSSLTTCCATLEQDFAFTWTILANLDNDNSGVFTALVDIKDTLTECCRTLEEDFAFTWTILNNLTTNVNLSGVFTALDACCSDITSSLTTCCATLEQDFAFTWTILADIKDDIDNTGIFTVLADNKNAITGCCAILEQDFAFTWTILASLDNDNSGVFTALADVKDTLTECCQTLEQDFAFKWTILSNLTPTVNLTGVFTAIQDVKSTITQCCRTLEQDFAFTWTILNNLTPTVNLTGVFTAIQDTKSTLTACCRTLEQDFAFTWTILEALTVTECDPIFISNADIGTTGYVITQPGTYKLKEDLFFNPLAAADMITISTHNVVLDLVCYTCAQGNTTPNVNAVRIGPGISDPHIFNGHIEGFTGVGIKGSSSTRALIKDMLFHDISGSAVELMGTSILNSVAGLLMENCLLTTIGTGTFTTSAIRIDFGRGYIIESLKIGGCGALNHDTNVIDMRSSQEGRISGVEIFECIGMNELNCVRVKDTSQTNFENFLISNNFSLGNSRGFLLDASQTCSANGFFDCAVVLCTGTAAVQGFSVLNNCDNHIFKDCQARLNRSTGTGATAIVQGFFFQNNQRNFLENCIAHGNVSQSTVGPHGALGFDFSTSFSATIDHCEATNQQSQVAAGGGNGAVGFRVDLGVGNIFTSCLSANQIIGFRINPNNTTNNVFIQCISTKNSTNYFQFPAGAIDTAASINNLNGLGNPWTNIAVG